MTVLAGLIAKGDQVSRHEAWPRVLVDGDLWTIAADQLAAGRLALLGLWGEVGTVHMALLDDDARKIAVVSLECPQKHFPSVARRHPPAMRLERAIQDLFGLMAEEIPDDRPWLDHRRWGVRHPLAEAAP